MNTKFLAVAVVALAGGQVGAAEIRWIGTPWSTSSWSEKINWNVNSTPVTTSEVYIDPDSTSRSTLDKNYSIAILDYMGVTSGGNLDLAGHALTVSYDYYNANFGTGNNFRPRAWTTGGGEIRASTSGANSNASTFQMLSVASIGGIPVKTADAVVQLDMGSVHIWSTVGKEYQIYSNSDVQLRGAIQSSTKQDSRLSGPGVDVTNSSWMTLPASYSSGEAKMVYFTGTSAGALNAQFTILNNFSNTNRQTLNITGAAYNLAASNAIAPVKLGNVHVNGTFGTSALSIQNTGASGLFTEGLNASVGGTTGSGSSNGGSFLNLASAATNNTSVVVGLGGASNTATAGAKSGTVLINLASNGTKSGLADTALACQSVNVAGDVYNYAKSSFVNFTGSGITSGTGSDFVIDLRSITQNTGSSIGYLELLNSGGEALFTDFLNGSYAATGDVSKFTLTGFDAVSDLAGGGRKSLSVALNNSVVGAFGQLMTLSYVGHNSSGYQDGVARYLTLGVKGSVVAAIPEPQTYALLLAGLGVVGFAARRRKSSR